MPISVCVATYKRPESLARLLEGLSALASDTPRFEVVVVDNDASGTTAAEVAAFADRLALRHAVEPRRGIAQARNRTVAVAVGEFLAFIDDDEIPDSRWLTELHAATVAARADAGFGPVDVQFEADVPAWIRHSQFFRHPILTTGSPVPWYLARTGNALVRRSSLPSCEAPFDERFGLTGGEDVDLFFRMAERGARLIAVESARVSESRPYQRCSAWWMLKRSFRRGGTVVDVAWRHTRGGARWRAGRRAARASLVAAARAVRHAKTPPRSFDHLLEAAQSLGMAAAVLGYRYREYGRPR